MENLPLGLLIRASFIRDSLAGRFFFLCYSYDGTVFELTVSYDRNYDAPVLHFRRNHRVGPGSESIAMELHPMFQTPYMVVHPCETAHTMRETGLAGSEYLEMWFAMFCQDILGILLRRRA